ncbi:aldolase [Microbulbifer sp. THAF38]|uniref:aldolase n=1 Tax=Microbulbifer sp. THAF38 TaxID=2587856 RepID=UPI001267C0A2|nr:aldolase [Microbulbifer sp. THAF38]QFT53263.1 Decarboxylase NovR [Microbulbifer sp. THAF38]
MAETLSMNKGELIERASESMKEHLGVPDWSLREKLALTCRILFAHGHDSGLAGQITARAETPGNYYTQRLGLGFDEITASNLLEVNEDLEVISGEGMANPANRFHTWIYRARPDVKCIVHSHPIHISALSMLERPLKISHMDACMLYDDIAFLKEWPGVPVGNNEGELIAEAIGDKRAILLAHHGLIIACRSVEEACSMALQCERAAHLQMLAESSGTIQDIKPELGREAHDWILQEKRSQATFAYYARRLLRDIDNTIDNPLG